MKGITFAVYIMNFGSVILISLKMNLGYIPDEDVYNLYKELYWNKVHGDELPNGVDYAVFDSAVNMGVGRASKLIQEAVGVATDGVLGQAAYRLFKKLMLKN
jgi:lysozyme family protein